MTKSKNTKKALLTSMLSLILCAAMLVGSTFAWFTDSVTSGLNKIVAGNLDIELTHTNAFVTSEVEVNTDTKLFTDNEGNQINWEPGVMAYENFTVKNVGSLALKYTLSLNVDSFNTVAGTDNSLKDVLKVAVVDGGFTGNNRAAALDLTYDKTIEDFEYEGRMDAGDDSKTYGIVIYWEPSADDNDYNLNNGKVASDASGDNNALYIDLGINLSAYQDTVENDSFDNNYDAAAYDSFAAADAAALDENPQRIYRKPDGTYGEFNTSNEHAFLTTYVARNNTATLTRSIGSVINEVSNSNGNHSNRHSELDLNRKTYTFGGLILRQTGSSKAENSSLNIKNGTMVGSTSKGHILQSSNARQSVTLDNIIMKWNTPRAWNANISNYYGLSLSSNVDGSVFTVKDSFLDCNASFSATNTSSMANPSRADITNTVVNGRLSGQSLIMNVDGCTVNGEVYCKGSGSFTTTVNIRNSTVNGDAFFAARSSQWTEVDISNTTINGNLETDLGSDNVHFRLINATVTGTLNYSGMPSWKIPKDKVTIVSGTFGFDPTNYLDEGSTATENDNGTWTVTAG